VGRNDVSGEPLRGLHILVIDDDATARDLVGGMLEHCGALVTTSGSAGAALVSLQRVLPELIVCALNLRTGGSAYDFVRRLRTESSLAASRIPVVAIVRDDKRHPLNEVLEAGFVGYIKAPFDPRQLCSVIADVDDAHPRERRTD